MSLPGSSGSAALYSVGLLQKNERKQISLHYVFIRPTLGAGRPGSASSAPRPALSSSPPQLSRQPKPANSCSGRPPAPAPCHCGLPWGPGCSGELEEPQGMGTGNSTRSASPYWALGGLLPAGCPPGPRGGGGGTRCGLHPLFACCPRRSQGCSRPGPKVCLPHARGKRAHLPHAQGK